MFGPVARRQVKRHLAPVRYAVLRALTTGLHFSCGGTEHRGKHANEGVFYGGLIIPPIGGSRKFDYHHKRNRHSKGLGSTRTFYFEVCPRPLLVNNSRIILAEEEIQWHRSLCSDNTLTAL